jgi:hypothetical protein
MPKKSMAQQFRDFRADSNEPMTKGEIRIAVGKKKRKAATKKRSLKSAKKTTPRN